MVLGDITVDKRAFIESCFSIIEEKKLDKNINIKKFKQDYFVIYF